MHGILLDIMNINSSLLSIAFFLTAKQLNLTVGTSHNLIFSTENGLDDFEYLPKEFAQAFNIERIIDSQGKSYVHCLHEDMNFVTKDLFPPYCWYTGLKRIFIIVYDTWMNNNKSRNLGVRVSGGSLYSAFRTGSLSNWDVDIDLILFSESYEDATKRVNLLSTALKKDGLQMTTHFRDSVRWYISVSSNISQSLLPSYGDLMVYYAPSQCVTSIMFENRLVLIGCDPLRGSHAISHRVHFRSRPDCFINQTVDPQCHNFTADSENWRPACYRSKGHNACFPNCTMGFPTGGKCSYDMPLNRQPYLNHVI